MISIIVTLLLSSTFSSATLFTDDVNKARALNDLHLGIAEGVQLSYVFFDDPTTFITVTGLHELILVDKNTNLNVTVGDMQMPINNIFAESTSNNLKTMCSKFTVSQSLHLGGQYVAVGLLNGKDINVNGSFMMDTVGKLMLHGKLCLMVVDSKQPEIEDMYGIDKVDFHFNIKGLKSNFQGIPLTMKNHFDKLVHKEMIKLMTSGMKYFNQKCTKEMHGKSLREVRKELLFP